MASVVALLLLVDALYTMCLPFRQHTCILHLNHTWWPCSSSTHPPPNSRGTHNVKWLSTLPKVGTSAHIQHDHNKIQGALVFHHIYCAYVRSKKSTRMALSNQHKPRIGCAIIVNIIVIKSGTIDLQTRIAIELHSIR